jgi:hypothetical protein
MFGWRTKADIEYLKKRVAELENELYRMKCDLRVKTRVRLDKSILPGTRTDSVFLNDVAVVTAVDLILEHLNLKLIGNTNPTFTLEKIDEPQKKKTEES